ncbi:protein-disulfide reductase DsbD family protein [Oceanicoccus sagamiensis]|uniref:Disulfide bond formation protein DsbD n=1 Tax=Oceanicoccus sagamiensis TaxID=716816 RepID=A0A1X9NAT2_9GAMM|nr:protein-disulfide reductase DsbD [Oceanicoccus sagamiensis]ARN73542.1 disulfide bond formation protein DsbD [Oceanicoccus sagamiensis]
MHAVFFALFCTLLLIQPASATTNSDPFGATSSPGSIAGMVEDDEFLPVEQAYQLTAEFDAPGQLRLYWDVADAYYLYRHGFQVELSANGEILSSELIIPKGLEKEDEYFGRVEVYYNYADLSLTGIPAEGNLALTVTSQGCADAGLCYPPYSEYFQLDGQQLSVTKIEPPNTQAAQTPSIVVPAASGSLLYMLLLAMVGGAILNLMPCVFPVLSLKVLAFANDKNHSQATHGLIYSAGVVISFVAVAALLVSLQAAGEAIGWGFHLQSPWFVAALAYLFFVMGLSLSGFIELGSSLMNVGDGLAQKSGYSGSFFTGILATVVASPCTAPFMGTALGYAVTQPTHIALLVFAALGVGMALPVLILSCSPRLLNKIPKPGAWMESLKQLLAFPLYATAVWLSWVVGKQAGVNGMALIMLGCVLIALALWLWSDKLWQRIVSAACAALAISILSSPLMSPTNSVASNKGEWQAYSPQTLADLRAAGKPVFLNITADWCITCLANEEVTLSTDTIKQAMKDAGVVYVKGDWTNRDPRITALLTEYGRTGIPLYVAYPADPQQPGTVLPQILSNDIVIEALEAIALSSDQLTNR